MGVVIGPTSCYAVSVHAFILLLIYQFESVRSSENVVDFMVAKIRKLSTEVQHVLQLASCLGNTFTIPMLATVSQLSNEEVENSLAVVLTAGLIHTFSETKAAAKNSVRTDYYK